MDIHIVDDDETIRILYASIAEKFGFSTLTFPCPDAYLEYMGSDEYSSPLLAILTDVNMPNMSGFELMDEVRKINSHQKFVVISGAPGVEPKEAPLACFYFTKPVSVGKLKAVFEALLQCVEWGNHPDRVGCTSIDDRCDFCIEDWHCPHHVF